MAHVTYLGCLPMAGPTRHLLPDRETDILTELAAPVRTFLLLHCRQDGLVYISDHWDEICVIPMKELINAI